MPRGLALLIAISLLGCRGSSPEPVAPEQAQPVCKNRRTLDEHVGRVCTVIGRYQIKTFPGKFGSKSPPLGDWPIVVLADGTEVMVESIWDPTKQPTPAFVDELRGRQVSVRGEVQTSPPKESPENFGFYCISPVESISPVER